MRVLFLASYLTILDCNVFNKNITGYGHMVRDIADYVSKSGVEVDVITSSAVTKGRKYKAFTILKRTWADILLHARPYYLKKMIRLIKTYHIPHSRIIKMSFYYLSAGYVENILKHGKYDIVHIHGIGFSNQPYIDCCEKLGIKYVVTLHGLNSFGNFTQMDSNEKQFEKDFLQYAIATNIPLTVVSTGILRTISDFLNVDNSKNCYVVTNGTDMDEKLNGKLDIRKKHGINDHKKIILCVGNITNNKNQLQIVRAYALLPEMLKNRLCIMFLGNDATNGIVANMIDKLGLEKNLILCGNISKNEICSYYQQADYTILASITEGFGLSIIEGFVYGLPNLAYANLDAIVDLFDEKVMITLAERRDENLADAIVQLLSREWDREYIKQYAKSFSLERMSREYINVYRDVLKKRS